MKWQTKKISYSKNNYSSSNPLKNYIHNAPLKVVDRLIPNANFKSAIDIGCADGVFLSTLSKKCETLSASDINEHFVSSIRDRRIKFYVDDIQKSQLPNNHFDLVTCLETLEHVSNPKKAISEIRRIMKSGSIGIITVPIEIGLPVLIKFLGRIMLGYPAKYRRMYSPSELYRAIIKKADREYHKEHLGHKGFDYRDIIKHVRRSEFKIEKIKYFPMNLLGPNLNFRIIMRFRK